MAATTFQQRIQGLLGNYTPVLMASATGIDGAALASTALTFESGFALDSHTPVFKIIKFASGTLGIGVTKTKTTAGDISALTPLLTLVTGANTCIVPLAGVVNASGNISEEVTTASIGASTFSVFIFGIKKP